MKHNAHPVDVQVGHRIRQQRTLAGLSQEKLGEAAGITFQQIQKYERGANRCSASMLVTFAKALGVPVGTFFDSPAGSGKKAHPAPEPDDLMLRRETLHLVRAYYGIESAAVRKQMFRAIKAVAKAA